MKKLNAIVAAFLLLAGCDRTEKANETRQPEQAVSPPAVLPPAFVGRWAARPGLCAEGAWTVTDRGIDTAGEISCRFDGPPQGAGPVEIDSICHAEGASKRWRLRMSYAASARSLLIENGPFAPIGLVRCDGGAKPPPEPNPPGAPDALPGGRTPVPEAPFTAQSAQGAAKVVQSYFALLESGSHDEARRLWSEGGRASSRSADAFADAFGRYNGGRALVGAPGRIEGAAGSLYVEVPIEIHGRRQGGSDVSGRGTVTLRRSNDVPGSTPEQRLWRIQEISLPAMARSFFSIRPVQAATASGWGSASSIGTLAYSGRAAGARRGSG